ncbi:MFS transporter [Embleya sp. NBC_00896]|uniref:MFS transporter n=1 Tax=Embleya sp. NBC_00896 TaxID=2975961 RepID=UPI002F906E5A|nr:MFS transporter [Embleya sp. NBC_00896]
MTTTRNEGAEAADPARDEGTTPAGSAVGVRETFDTAPVAPAATSSKTGSGYGQVFAVREFRPVFAAHVLSMTGSVLAQVALSVLVYRLTGSALLTALTYALGFLPYAIGGTVLAGVADRYAARTVLVVCDVLCVACAAVMATPGTPVAVLLTLRFAMALVAPVFSGTRAASLADILGEGDALILGRSLIRMVAQGAQVAGFGLGGLLLVVVGPREALMITAVTFAGSALLLRFGTRNRPARAPREGGPESGGGGTRRLLANRRLRNLLVLFWIQPFFLVVPEALAAPYTDGIGAGTTGLGLFMAAMPVGTLLGELLAGTLLGPEARSRIAGPLALLSLLPYLGFAVRPSLPWAIAAMFATGLCGAYTLGVDQWILAAIPEGMQGRAMTLMAAGLMTIQGVGMALAGAAAEFGAPHVVTAWAGLLGTVCVALALRSARRAHGKS